MANSTSSENRTNFEQESLVSQVSARQPCVYEDLFCHLT